MEAIRKQASKLREQVARQQQVSATPPLFPRSPLPSPAAGSHRPHAHEIRSLSPVGIVVGD